MSEEKRRRIPYYASIGLSLWLTHDGTDIVNYVFSVRDLPANGTIEDVLQALVAQAEENGVRPVTEEELAGFAKQQCKVAQEEELREIMKTGSRNPERLRAFLQYYEGRAGGDA